jgi:hypothetical protein
MCSRADHSGLILAARITLAHFSVSSAIKMKNADAPAVKREAEEDWEKERWR